MPTNHHSSQGDCMSQSGHGKTSKSNDTASGAAEWAEHEHVSDPAIAAAERLLESSGTPEQAKHVIDVAHNQAPDDPTRNLATQAGFTSYLELLSASTRVDGDEPWYVVQLPTGQWMAWNETSLESANYDSRSAAEDGIQRRALRR